MRATGKGCCKDERSSPLCFGYPHAKGDAKRAVYRTLAIEPAR
jgi:hypothetical protein